MTLVWETNLSLFDYWQAVSNQFSKNISKENYLEFFQKMRQSWTKYFETKSSRMLLPRKKIGLSCQKVTSTLSRGMEGDKKNLNLVLVS